jgi:hypothetical protein
MHVKKHLCPEEVGSKEKDTHFYHAMLGIELMPKIIISLVVLRGRGSEVSLLFGITCILRWSLIVYSGTVNKQ